MADGIDDISGGENDKIDNVEPPEEYPFLTCSVFIRDFVAMCEEPEMIDDVLESAVPEKKATDHFLGFVVRKYQ